MAGQRRPTVLVKMPPIETISDLFDAGAQWSIKEYLDGNSAASSVDTLLSARYGDTLVASGDTIREFVRLTGDAMAAAAELESGRLTALTEIPEIPSPLVRTTFSTQGVVTVIAEDMGTADEPFTTVLPFSAQTQTQPSLEEIALKIETAIAEAERDDSKRKQRHRRNRERKSLMDQTGNTLEYDVVPFFVWRTC